MSESNGTILFLSIVRSLGSSFFRFTGECASTIFQNRSYLPFNGLVVAIGGANLRRANVGVCTFRGTPGYTFWEALKEDLAAKMGRRWLY